MYTIQVLARAHYHPCITDSGLFVESIIKRTLNSPHSVDTSRILHLSKPRLGPVYKALPVKWQPFSRRLTHARADLCADKVSSWILSILPWETAMTLQH